jgi:hypothetical protein
MADPDHARRQRNRQHRHRVDPITERNVVRAMLAPLAVKVLIKRWPGKMPEPEK